MQHFLRTVIAHASLLALFASCASIVSESTYPVTINTTPRHVDLLITDAYGAVVFQGQTPTTIPLKSSRGYFKPARYKVTLEYYGHRPHTFFIEADINGWYFGNFLFGGPIGFLVVDPLTGAMWKIPAQYYNFTLAPTDEASTKSLQLLDLQQVPEHLRDKLIPLEQEKKH